MYRPAYVEEIFLAQTCLKLIQSKNVRNGMPQGGQGNIKPPSGGRYKRKRRIFFNSIALQEKVHPSNDDLPQKNDTATAQGADDVLNLSTKKNNLNRDSANNKTNT